MLDKIRKWILENDMIKDGERIVAGVSGGADSVALLFVLLELQEEYHLTLSVVHVNHGIRKEEAKRDADYVKKLCMEQAIPFFLYEASIPELSKKWQVSEETAGRKFRYQCFFEAAKKAGASCIVTAHHMGDQAETVLFHLARGSSLIGAVGIRPIRMVEEENICIIRPLLCCAKQELTAYLKEKGISWCEDVTNEDDSYARNKIRNQIVPALSEINKEAVGHIAEFASDVAKYSDFFDQAVEQYLQKEVICIYDKKVSHCKMKEASSKVLCTTDRYRLAAQNPLLAKAVIYRMIAIGTGQKQDITRTHVQQVYALLEGQSGRRISLPSYTEAEISYDRLLIVKKQEENGQIFFDYCISLEEIWNKGEELRISLPGKGVLLVKICTREEFENNGENVKNYYTKFFACDKIKDTLHVRNPLQKDYLIINDKGNHKRVTRYFIDEKIPTDVRKKQYLVTLGNEVLWHVGGRRGERYKVNSKTQYILRLRYEGGYDEGSD